MRIQIEKVLCVICEVCIGIAPRRFEMQDDIAAILEEVAHEDLDDAANEAKEICPEGTIIVEVNRFFPAVVD